MNTQDETHLPPSEAKLPPAKKQPRKKRRQRTGSFGRFLRRTLLLLLTLLLLAMAGTGLLLDTLLNGPSPAVRDLITATLWEYSATAQIPELFLEPDVLEQIRNQAGTAPADTVSDPGMILLTDHAEAWLDCPDGIRLTEHTTDTFRSQVLLIRDPDSLHLVTNTDSAGVLTQKRVLAAVSVTSPDPESGFAGFTEEGILIVSTSPTEGQNFPGIREGRACGPVLIMNGTVNQAVYGANSGIVPRSALGQRADGTVILVYLSGGTFRNLTDILVEYGAVNGCSLSSGSDSSLRFLDSEGLAHTFPETEQKHPAFTGDFWLVRPSGEG